MRAVEACAAVGPHVLVRSLQPSDAAVGQQEFHRSMLMVLHTSAKCTASAAAAAAVHDRRWLLVRRPVRCMVLSTCYGCL
jgi:hypothetical protein